MSLKPCQNVQAKIQETIRDFVVDAYSEPVLGRDQKSAVMMYKGLPW